MKHLDLAAFVAVLALAAFDGLADAPDEERAARQLGALIEQAGGDWDVALMTIRSVSVERDHRGPFVALTAVRPCFAAPDYGARPLGAILEKLSEPGQPLGAVRWRLEMSTENLCD